MNELLATQIQQELGRVQIQITQLEQYKQSLAQTLNAMQALKGSVNPIRRPAAVEAAATETAQGPELPDNELYPPRPVPGLTSSPLNLKEQPNTLEMTRTILKNAGGEEKSVDELRQLIRTTYGIEPAKSLDQMLYKRAAAGRGFYKTEDGKFGLSELRKGIAIDEVPLVSTAVV
jgi:hypothetical protein